MKKEDIKKALKKCNMQVDDYINMSFDDIAFIMREIDEALPKGEKLSYTVEHLLNKEQLEWLQAEYWSESLGKIIIYNCHWYSNFEDENDFIEKVYSTHNEVLKLEKSISKIS